MSVRNLARLFKPRSIALIGGDAVTLSIGATAARNLLRGGFAGPIMPVDPERAAIESVLTYRDVESLPLPPDLAVIATPPETVPGLIAALGAKGCRAAVVLTGAFGTLDPEHGTALRQAMLDAAKPHLLRLVGPNSLGIAVPGIGLQANSAHAMPLPGDVACVSQSASVVGTLIDWATRHGIGFSHVVSLGDMCDVDLGDMLDYLAADPAVRSILLYVERVTSARKFMSAARSAARVKPVIVVKSGRFAASAQAASSHSMALAGADEIYDAAFRRAGMLRVLTLDEMFAALETLSHGRVLTGDRLAILTNGGGLGVLATDALVEKGGRLAQLDPATLAALDEVLPACWSKGNPVDILGDAPGARYAAALERLVRDKQIDGCLVLNGPQATASPIEAAEAVVASLERIELRARAKIFVSWLGDGTAAEARAVFTKAGLPCYRTPEHAVAGFMHMLEYRRNQQLLMRVPPSVPDEFQADREAARAIVEAARAAGRDWLDETDGKRLLAAYGIPVNRVRRVATVEEVGAATAEIGPCVALKILSPDILHKSDVGGVALDLNGPEQAMAAAGAMLDTLRRIRPEARIDGFTVEEMVRRADAAELILGLATDPTFGPVVLFGHGGTKVGIVEDTALALAPLDMVLAQDLIRSTRVHRRLLGFRNVPAADIDAVALTLVKLSQMAADLPEIYELDINPLLADKDGVVALDARIRLDAPAKRPGFAILPYPSDRESELTLPDGTVLQIRPIRPEDAPRLERNFRRTRSEDIHSRFFASMTALPPSLLARLTQLDYDREIALAALPRPGEAADPDDGYGIVRLAADPDNDQAEFALIVRSDWHGRGLGRALMQLILDYARERGIRTVWGTVLRENTGMIKLVRSLGFAIKVEDDPTTVHAEIRLGMP